MNGVKSSFCFSLQDRAVIVGAMVIGEPATRGVDVAYGGKENMIEIRRLVCIDSAPRNCESYFIGYVLRWLKRNTRIKIVIAYSDLQYGHNGTIYAASNFRLLRTIPGAIKIEWNGKLYHDRSMRVRYNGYLKPFAAKLAQAYRLGLTRNIVTAGKNVWLYDLS